MPEVTQELEAEPELEPCSKFSAWSSLPRRSMCRIVIQGPGSLDPPAGKGKESVWGWAGAYSHGCGQVTAGVQQEVRDTVLILIAAIPEGYLGQGEAGMGGWIGHPELPAPIFAVGHPLSPQHTSSSFCGTRHRLCFFCLFHSTMLLFLMLWHRQSLL